MNRVEVQVGDKTISLETGRLARQANGAVLVRCGDTVVLVSAVGREDTREGQDFFPLTVDVEERHYAAGKIPGGFIKRESRPSEKAILAARQIDRPIRPLFAKGFMNEVHIVATTLSVDFENAYDTLASIGASAALTLSEIPFEGPIGSVRVGRIDGELVINPTLEETQNESDLDLVVTGTADAIVMVEAGAKEITEDVVVEALKLAHAEIRKLIDVQLELQRLAGKPKWPVAAYAVDDGVLEEVRTQFGAALDAATQAEDKKARQDATADVKKAAIEALVGEDAEAERAVQVKRAVAKLEKDIVRDRIAVQKRRPDGRGTDEIRQITCEVGVIPRTHGSALFTRGQTQAMSLLTLGGTGEFQRIDGLGIEDKKRYIHHYNFPPYSVGETGFMRGPKRRDIGHGALAERALLPVLPDELDFPYTIRIVSEILESNGSSSMASVCGSTLSLMDAGVKISKPVAGIAMGLIKEGDDYVVLTDIAGVEDHLGDMDFKVAGTADGITALQMDIKIKGVTFEILTEALEQARRARLFILERMLATIPEPRSELSQWAPRIFTIQINPDQIGLVIGKGGETIRGMTDEFSADIDIQDDGTIFICAPDQESAEGVMNRIQAMTKEIEVGDVFTGRVVKTTDFGAFIELKKGTDGLIHISRLGAKGERVKSVEDVVKRGDTVTVEVVEIDKARNRIGLKPLKLPDADVEGRPATEAYRLTTLENGLRVATERLDTVRSVALGLYIAAGSRLEPPEIAGVSHFIEHLIFKGSDRYSAWDIARIFDDMGGEPNAATSKEHTVVHARFLDDDLDRAFAVIAEMVARPGFADLDQEREVVLEEVAMYEDSPPELVHDDLAEAVFGDHPLGRPIIGRSETLARIDHDTVRAYHDAHYVNPGIVVAASGNVDHDHLCELTAQHFRPEPGAVVPRPELSPPGMRHVARFTQKDTEQYHICFGGPGPRRADPDRYAVFVVDTVLGGSWSSLLFQEVREKRGLAYSVYSYTSLYADAGLTAIYVGSREEAVREAMEVIQEVLHDFDAGHRRGRHRARQEPPQGAARAEHGEPREPHAGPGPLRAHGAARAERRRGAAAHRRRHERRCDGRGAAVL